MRKKVQVTIERDGEKDFILHVPAKNVLEAVAKAYMHFVNEGYSVHDVTGIRTEKSDSYL